jgi:hypothetical protein
LAFKKRISAGSAVFGAVLLLSTTALSAATDPAGAPAPDPNISADYTIYIGGFMAAEGSIDAALTDDGYFVKSQLGIAGMPARFYNAQWNMTSEGELADDGLRPSRFAFVSDEKGKVKHREITYDGSGLPTPVFDPPEEDAIEVLPFERRNALDPVSALLLPVSADSNPCDRRIPVYDGKRRYDLQLSYDREDQVTTRNKGYSGNAIVCSVHVNPRTGMRQGKFTTMLQQRDNTRIWLAEIEGESLYIPVRIQVRTPIGAAVMDIVKLRHDPRDDADRVDTAMR